MLKNEGELSSGLDINFSLVISTLGRREELARCLSALNRQTYRPNQVIVVDQNAPGWLDDVIAPFCGSALPILHVRSEKGLSRGRNYGLQFCSGNVIGFPDDDCWYPDDLLQKLAMHFANETFDGISVPLRNERNQTIMLRWPGQHMFVTRHNVWDTCISPGLFVRKRVVDEVDGFDERLGVGSPFGLESGEETDFVLRILKMHGRILFDPSLYVFHPDKPAGVAPPARARAYGRGFGFIFATHDLSKIKFLRYVTRALGGCALALMRFRTEVATFYIHSALGRLEGFRMGRQSGPLNGSGGRSPGKSTP